MGCIKIEKATMGYIKQSKTMNRLERAYRIYLSVQYNTPERREKIKQAVRRLRSKRVSCNNCKNYERRTQMSGYCSKREIRVSSNYNCEEFNALNDADKATNDFANVFTEESLSVVLTVEQLREAISKNNCVEINIIRDREV